MLVDVGRDQLAGLLQDFVPLAPSPRDQDRQLGQAEQDEDEELGEQQWVALRPGVA